MWTEEQLANAHTIIDVGVRLGASHRDIRIALMTAMQESSLQNLSGGDGSSVGLFQQIDDWGSAADRHNPEIAATMFFTGGQQGQSGLFDIANRDSMSLGRAAQSVQHSAYPTYYTKWHDEAALILQTADNAPPADPNEVTHLADDTTGVQPITDGVLSDSWGASRSGGRHHEGIDIMAPEGTPIHAVVGGQVVKGFDDPLGGTVVRIEGDDGKYYYYAHLSGVADGLEVGDRVEMGEVIGDVGNTGDAAGGPTHLHLGIYVDGQAVDPYPLLTGLPDFDGTSGTSGVGLAADGGDEFDADTGQPIVAKDSDHDDITDEFEAMLGTNPHAKDSDHDGRSDLDEIYAQTDPNSAGGDGKGADDPWHIPLEALQHGFGPGELLDTDHDGLSDAREAQLGLDPYDADSDDDHVSDGIEYRLGSNPLSMDTNSDGITDVHEYAEGTLGPADIPDDPGAALDSAH